jgi:myo-inositol-1(or 4)-monophosphatase
MFVLCVYGDTLWKITTISEEKHEYNKNNNQMHLPFDIQRAKTVALNAALEAGQLIRTVMLDTSAHTMRSKSTLTDLVTETDEKCDRLIIERLKQEFPDFSFITEETHNQATELTDEPTWIIDPIDGTTNFVHRYPHVAVSIGLTFNKQCILGVVVLPMLLETYTAVSGQGAFKTDIHRSEPFRLSVSKNTTLDTSLVSSNFPYGRGDETLKPVFSRYEALLKKNVRGIRGSGSAVVNLMSVASGGLEAYFENGLQSWDMAAGKVIVEEAGGVVVDIDGSPLDLMKRRILAVNSEELQKQLSEVLVDSDKQFQ